MIYTTLMNVQELHSILVNQKITGKKKRLFTYYGEMVGYSIGQT